MPTQSKDHRYRNNRKREAADSKVKFRGNGKKLKDTQGITFPKGPGPGVWPGAQPASGAGAKNTGHTHARTRQALHTFNMKQDSAPEIITAMDCMQAAKNCPGLADVDYVSSMNISPLPTMTFQVANQVSQAWNI
jgi:hypothetical protein